MQMKVIDFKKIIVAEDSHICHSLMRDYIKNLGLEQQTSFFYDGTSVYNEVNQALRQTMSAINTLRSERERPYVFKPLEIMILDNQMPGMIGIELVKKIKSEIEGINCSQNKVVVQEPKFVICSAFLTA
jgi:CheY-like chemotaxis protein